MIIKDVRLSRNHDSTTLSARCKVRKLGWDTIYFTVCGVERFDYVFNDASPFAAALLLPAMRQGEDLIIKGSVSNQLYKGMQAVMQEVLGWDIGLKPIEIKVDTLAEDTYRPSKTATFFSGGVDSFYTYLKHRDDADKADRVDSFILVNNNFDIDPRNKKLWEMTLKNIKAIAADGHIELVVVESNVNTRELLAPIVAWDFIHGACLAATGLFLRPAFRKIYVPSTHSVDEQIPWGSNLALDKLWSTEETVFAHDGSETTRLNKVISQIALSPIALKHLRVCYKNTQGTYNCGACDKCMRTMVNLYIAGALERSSTFPHTLNLGLIATTPTIKGKDGGIFHNENLSALKKRHLNPELQQAIKSSLNRTAEIKVSWSEKASRAIIYLDHNYTRGLIYANLSRLFGKKFV